MTAVKNIKKHSVRLCCFVLTLVMCLTGCGKEKSKNIEDDFGEDEFVAAMAQAQSTSKKNNGKKRVAITYDDGPHNVRTKAIVDELAKYGYNATFFVVGNRVDGTEYNGASAMKYAAEKGNEIAIHGYTHSVYYDNCSDEVYKKELSKTEAVIKNSISGYSVRLMRPVGGRITGERIQNSKYSIIMWNIDSEDWKYKYKSGDSDAEAKQKVDTIVNNVMSSVSDGSIILMHDIYESTYDATVLILQRLHKEGYEVVTVSELLGSEMSAGKKYSRATGSKTGATA